MLANSRINKTPMAMGPMLLSISMSALVPWANEPPAVGAASLSVCNAKRSAAVKIGVHLLFNGIRRDTTVQVIDKMPPAYGNAASRALKGAVHAMLRSECCCVSAEH